MVAGYRKWFIDLLNFESIKVMYALERTYVYPTKQGEPQCIL